MISDLSHRAIEEMDAERVSLCAHVAICGLQYLLKAGFEVPGLGELWSLAFKAEQGLDESAIERITVEIEALREKLE